MPPPADRREVMPVAGGSTLAYRVSGAGTPLFCIPGGPGFGGDYLGDVAGVGTTRQLIVVDLPGSGLSTKPATSQGYSLDAALAAIDELRLHLGLEKIDLFGHSHGAFVALAYAARFPRHTGAIVLCSMPLDFSSPPDQNLCFVKPDAQTRDYMQGMIRGANFAAFNAFMQDRPQTHEILALLDQAQRLTLIYGDADPVRPAAAPEMARHDMRIIPGAAHFPWWEQRAAIRTAISAELDGPSPALG